MITIYGMRKPRDIALRGFRFIIRVKVKVEPGRVYIVNIVQPVAPYTGFYSLFLGVDG